MITFKSFKVNGKLSQHSFTLCTLLHFWHASQNLLQERCITQDSLPTTNYVAMKREGEKSEVTIKRVEILYQCREGKRRYENYLS
jgi:hypothetical protein